MPNTYTQLHIQYVFAVRFRKALINIEWQDRLHQYITGIFQKNNHKMLQINSMPDHIHILVGLRPNQSVSSIIQNVKTESSKWINREYSPGHPFAWQEGFGAFSYSKCHVPRVIRYIKNQQKHHQQITFLEEYKRFLDSFDIEYDERYLFQRPE
jgi:putative transposase